MTDRINIAADTFNSGRNCAQSVLSSFADFLNKDMGDLFAVASGFGGGMGKLQNTCGAVTGAYMALGYYASAQSTDPAEAKGIAMTMVREFDAKYREKLGSTSCLEILGADMNTEEGVKEINEKDLFHTVCVDAVKVAVEIAQEMMGTD